jgi:hypothetical protein
VISSNELKMDPEKVKVIREWPSPRSMFEVRSFHGLVSFYRKFIRDFSGICAPMKDMVKKWHKYFNWIEEVERRFNILKEKITERPILIWPNFEKTFQEFQVNTLGFEHLKDMYHDDAYFKEAYEACLNPMLIYRSQWTK